MSQWERQRDIRKKLSEQNIECRMEEREVSEHGEKEMERENGMPDRSVVGGDSTMWLRIHVPEKW